MSDLEFGIVKSFNPNTNYGFLFVADENGRPTKEEVYFHYNSGRHVDHDGNEPVFGGKTTIKAGRTQFMPAPMDGDKVIFRRVRADKGFQAYPWTYVSDWNKQSEQLAERLMVRLVRTQRGLHRQNYGDVKVSYLWTGQNLAELSVTHPKSTRRTANGPRLFDSLAVTTTDDSTIEHHFEVLKGDEWIEWEDPRQFLCCVRKEDFARHAREGQVQEVCIHQ